MGSLGFDAWQAIQRCETIVCTYTNKQDATVTIRKDAVPDNAQDFHYQVTGSGLTQFDLDDDADPTL